MNSNRSLRSNTNLTGRTSPNIQTSKADRSSPPITNQFSRVREADRETNFSSVKNFTDGDRKFHRTAFERCSDPPDREAITNRERFVQALNYVGYDLLDNKIDELWSRYKPRLTLNKFERILFDEEPVNQRGLEDAFETLYNKDRKPYWNMIDYNQFHKDMIEHGDCLTKDEFEKLRYLLGTDQGKFDVKKLIRNIEETKTNCREKILREQREQRRDEFENPPSRMNSQRSNTVRITIEPASKKLDIPPTTRTSHMKGAFFCEYNDSPMQALYYSIAYAFELKRNTPIWITIKPVLSHYHQDQTFDKLDIRLFLFEVIPQKTSRRLVHISTERTGNKSYLHLNDLPKGSYEILPVTFGGVLRTRSREINDRQPTKRLRETKRSGPPSMTNDYRMALEFVFDIFDFDENKQLDRREYNLWTLRTVGDEITDDDWASVREHVRLDRDENVSKEKFLVLNDFEVQHKNTTEQVLWVGLNRLGFNYALELDMMCPFSLTVNINDPGLHLEPTSYVELNEIKKTLIKFIKDKGEKIRMNNPSIQCFNYQDGSGSILYAENRSTSDVRLSIQVTRSINSALNLPINQRKPTVIDVRRDSTQIIWFAHKLDSQRAMELDANIEIQ